MKYYSEKLLKLFDTEAQLNDAETALELKEKEQEQTKKELADKVAAADKEVEEAYSYYTDVRRETEAIAKEANECIAKMLQDARSVILKAEKKKTDAIVEFNSKFGTYKAVYSGERAKKEAERVQTLINNLFTW